MRADDALGRFLLSLAILEVVGKGGRERIAVVAV